MAPRKTLVSDSLKPFHKFEGSHPEQVPKWEKSKDNLQFSSKLSYLRNGVRPARCFTKISNLSSPDLASAECRPMLHSSLDRTLSRPILLLKLIVGLNKRKRWRQPFYAAREHRGFPTTIAIGTKIRYPHFYARKQNASRVLAIVWASVPLSLWRKGWRQIDNLRRGTAIGFRASREHYLKFLVKRTLRRCRLGTS